MQISGPNATARLVGSATIVNGGVSAFLGTDRFTANRIQAKLIFTSDQVEIEQASGYLGGGQFTATGGATLAGLKLQAFRLRHRRQQCDGAAAKGLHYDRRRAA